MNKYITTAEALTPLARATDQSGNPRWEYTESPRECGSIAQPLLLGMELNNDFRTIRQEGRCLGGSSESPGELG